MAGPLAGLEVVELASDDAAFAGKLMADLGADVILVEPPGGHRSRTHGPFVGDEEDPERCLWWWHYHTSKRGVVADLDDAAHRERLRALLLGADVVLEAEPPGRLAALSLDHADLRAEVPALVWVSVTPFGRDNPRTHEPATDLTLLAGGGPVWNCGYDDHSLPPVRGGGNQAAHLSGSWAVIGALTAVLQRDLTGVGQHVDVSMHAAANVTTEAGSYHWLVARETVQRQTGRHAATRPTTPTQILAADGRWVQAALAPHRPRELQALLDWLDEAGLTEEVEDLALLQLGIERGGLHVSEIGQDPVATEIFGASRDALGFLCSRLPAYEFFRGSQERGFQVGVVNSADETLEDPHLRERGFWVGVDHEEVGPVLHPGPPFRMSRTPWAISRRAPRLGEHDAEVWA